MTSDDYIIHNGEIYHYGVKGMKWGIRRAKNNPAQYTRKQVKKEYREDNRNAFEFGKIATVYGHAAAKSTNRTVKLQNKLDEQYSKDPSGSSRKIKKLQNKWQASAKTSLELAEMYAKTRDAAEKHCKYLIDKYGKEAVSSIKYKDIKLRKGEGAPNSFKSMNESTTYKSEYVTSIGASAVSGMLAATGHVPLAFIFVPNSTRNKASQLESMTYHDNIRKRRN